jgi:hypothetical protein
MFGLGRTFTKTSSKIVPTATILSSTTVTSTITTTVDLWKGTPACSTVPDFAWLYTRSRAAEHSPDLLDRACGCIEIPLSTSTVVATSTETPTSTTIQGITGLVQKTAVQTHTATQTKTKFIYLVDRPHTELNASSRGHMERLDRTNVSAAFSLPEAAHATSKYQGLHAVDSLQRPYLLDIAKEGF